MLQEGVDKNIEWSDSPGNSYDVWIARAPSGFVVSVSILQNGNAIPDDKYRCLYFGENVSTFSTSDNSCSSWTRLTDPSGHLKEEQMRFGSRSSSVILISTSLASTYSLSIIFRAIKIHGKCQIIMFLLAIFANEDIDNNNENNEAINSKTSTQMS